MLILYLCYYPGVYLALKDVFYANNSNINIRNIGNDSDSPNGALQCITDRMPCCFSSDHRFGECTWYLPNGEPVQGTTTTIAFYRNRGDNGEVFLNRPSDVMSPFGQFCCEVPDATSTDQTLCVNIGELLNSTCHGSNPIFSFFRWSIHYTFWLPQSHCW